MADTYTPRNRLIKPEIGQYPNAWGLVLNNKDFELIDEAMDGMAGFTLSGSKTLSSNNAAADESRMRFLKITSGTGGTITIPSVEKWYIVRNGSSGNVTFTAGGTTAVVAAGLLTIVVCDGGNCYTMDFTAAAAAAVVAQLAAEAAQAAAETAQGLAEAAQTGAETAETGAQTAQGLSEDARDAAIVAQGFAEAAQAATEAVLADAIAAGSILPVQTGNSGKVLTTDGTTPSWVFVAPVLLSSSTSSTSPWEFTGIAADTYSELYLVWEETISSGTSVYYDVAFQNQASSWSSYARIGSGTYSPTAETLRGAVSLFATKQNQGPGVGFFSNSALTGSLAGSTYNNSGFWAAAGGLLGVRLRRNGSASGVTAVSVKLYGRR